MVMNGNKTEIGITANVTNVNPVKRDGSPIVFPITLKHSFISFHSLLSVFMLFGDGITININDMQAVIAPTTSKSHTYSISKKAISVAPIIGAIIPHIDCMD